MEKKYTLQNMNGDTENDEKTCSLNDMNCLGEDKKDGKKSCGRNGMNYVGKEKE